MLNMEVDVICSTISSESSYILKLECILIHYSNDLRPHLVSQRLLHCAHTETCTHRHLHPNSQCGTVIPEILNPHAAYSHLKLLSTPKPLQAQTLNGKTLFPQTRKPKPNPRPQTKRRLLNACSVSCPKPKSPSS